MSLSSKELYDFARTVSGEPIDTMSKRAKFTVKVVPAGLEFTPLSTNKPRIHNAKTLEKVLATLARTGSLERKNYADITFNSSYVLALINRYLAK